MNPTPTQKVTKKDMKEKIIFLMTEFFKNRERINEIKITRSGWYHKLGLKANEPVCRKVNQYNDSNCFEGIPRPREEFCDTCLKRTEFFEELKKLKYRNIVILRAVKNNLNKIPL